MLALTLAAFVVAGVCAACGWQADAPAAAPTVGPASGPASAPTAPARLAPTVKPSPPSPEPLVALATADAARRTGTGPNDVRIVRIEARAWPDRSLGCPRPGMGYAQAITPGYLIVADAAGQQLEYHTDHAQVFLCAS